MTINLTLLIQAVHFGIAYIILRYGLFKPAVAILSFEKKLHDELENNIATMTHVTNDARNELELRKDAILKTIAYHYPTEISTAIFNFPDISLQVNACIPNQQEVNALRGDIVRAVKSKVIS